MSKEYWQQVFACTTHFRVSIQIELADEGNGEELLLGETPFWFDYCGCEQEGPLWATHFWVATLTQEQLQALLSWYCYQEDDASFPEEHIAVFDGNMRRVAGIEFSAVSPGEWANKVTILAYPDFFYVDETLLQCVSQAG